MFNPSDQRSPPLRLFPKHLMQRNQNIEPMGSNEFLVLSRDEVLPLFPEKG
jgi:hypothetical protein